MLGLSKQPNLGAFDVTPIGCTQNAVDLNLRLMRWRAAPGIDLESIKSMRALLIGAGTLG